MRKTIYKTEARSAIIAAVVALVVAAPLSNAAHEGVSSAVKIVKGKQGKTGKRGPRGFRGPTGATGPQGQRGIAGISAVPRQSAIIPPGSTRTIASQCPNRSAASGNWIAVDPGTPAIEVVDEGISADATYYYAVLKNTGARPRDVLAQATCTIPE